MLFIWIKALHVIAIIAWMAGLLYLPRLFVYHAQAGAGSPSETFKVMERKLYSIIMTPAMLVSWAAGLYLAVEGGYFHNGWFHAKLALVLLMTGVHFYDGALIRAFAADTNQLSSRFFRFFNEAPTLLMIGVVILVIVKPF